MEDLTEDELLVLKKFYIKLPDLAEKEEDLYSSPSLDEAYNYHEEKNVRHKSKTAKKPTPE